MTDADRTDGPLVDILPLDAGAIEGALARLWRASYQETEAPGRMYKIALSNLIVLTTPESRDDAEKIIRHFDTRTPSRVLLIIIDENLTESPHAHISASCNLTEGMQQKLCWEQVTIEATPDKLPDITGLIRSLLTGGEIPIILADLYGLKRRIDYRQKIYRLANFVFVDGRGRFEALLPPPGAFVDQHIYGFDWVEIDTVREAVREYFDNPQRLGRFDRLEAITIGYGSERNEISAPAFLLAGWVAASMGLETDTPMGQSVHMTGPGGTDVTLRFNREQDAAPGWLQLEFRFADGEAAAFITEDGGVRICTGAGTRLFRPRRPFDRNAFVFEQSSKDRSRSSYAVSYRAAVSLYNLMRGISGRRSMIVVDDATRLARVTARIFYSLALRTLAFKGRFHVALAGGSTPKAIYREMVASSYAGAVAWEDVYFFFGDERPVGPEHADSNFKLANDCLFKPLGISDANVFRIESESSKYRDVVDAYAETIATTVPIDMQGRPRFDLIFLGMGDDGHTASLFPGLDDDRIGPDRPVIYQYVPGMEQVRFSFNYGLINAAANVIFVATGEKKAAALQTVFVPDANRPLPAGRINPDDGNILWLVDAAAAARLEGIPLPLEVSRW